MINLEDFRAGLFSIPFAGAAELPACCGRCRYLVHEESQVCYCETPFYYLCAYSWPDRVSQETPPCLAGEGEKETG
uniref:Uncharacterized protein n=1 Tax=Desulfobacca acetoxidans TaxID=60893 RepID=A0A7C3Z1U0_9BACT